MKSRYFLFIAFFCLISIAFSQNSNDANFHELYFHVISDSNRNCLLVSTIVFDSEKTIGKLIKVDSHGNLINDFIYEEEEGDVYFFNIHFINNSYFVFGSISNDSHNYLLTIQLNEYFELIQIKKYRLPENKHIQQFYSIFDSDSNFVFSGYAGDNYSMFFYKIDQNCDSLCSKFFNTSYQAAYQIHESNDKSKYSVFLDGYLPHFQTGGILEMSKTFDTISFHLIETYIRHVSSSLKMSDSTFIVSSINLLDDYKLFLNSIKYDGSILHSDTFYKATGMKEFPAFRQGISKNSDNYYYIGSTSNFDYSAPSFSPNDSWFHLIKLNQDLGIIWEKWYGGDAYYSLNSILATSDGGCLMVGTKYSHSVENQFIQGYYIKVDANGNEEWTLDVEIPEWSYKVYPNPTQSVFNIENNEMDIHSVELFDISGKLLNSVQDCNNRTISIDLSSFPPGVYLAKIKSSKGIRTEKVVRN